MLKKKRLIVILMLCIILIGCAIIKVSSELPQFIKDRSNIKVYLKLNPFDLRFDTENYIIYINEKAFKNIENNTETFFQNIGQEATNKSTYIKETIDNKVEYIRNHFSGDGGR